VNFLDSTIFINWFKATKRDLLKPETSASGFILSRIESGERAVTSSIVKDEVAIWLSRYKRSKLPDFLDSLQAYTSLTIESSSMEDQVQAERRLGSYPLGYLDCINLAIMSRNHINTIYTSDKGFDRVPGIRRVFESSLEDPQFTGFMKWARENL
jgi:predicted nucleic acid-binding protein